MTFDPAKLPIPPCRKCCALSSAEYNPQVTKEKTPVSVRFNIKIQHIYMCSICIITKEYKVFFGKLCQAKNGVCDDSPPKRRTVAETFAWKLSLGSACLLVTMTITHHKGPPQQLWEKSGTKYIIPPKPWMQTQYPSWVKLEKQTSTVQTGTA